MFLKSYLQINLNSKRLLCENKGSTMVESAIILPLVILTMISVVYLFINIYSQASLQANMHILLRHEVATANDLTSVAISDAYERDKYRQVAENKAIDIVEKKRFVNSYLEASTSMEYLGGGLTRGSVYKMKYYGRFYKIDEAKGVRIRDLGTSIIGDFF